MKRGKYDYFERWIHRTFCQKLKINCNNNLKHETIDFTDELDDEEEIISVSDNDFDYSKTEKNNSGVNFKHCCYWILPLSHT